MDNDKHLEWRHEVGCNTEKELLKKAEEILKEDYLSSEDLDNLKDIWKTLWYIRQCRM